MHRLFLVALLFLLPFDGNVTHGGTHGLTWSALSKEHQAKRGETNALITFSYTNLTSEEIVITATRPSCHCTVLKEFELPRKVAPGKSGKLAVNVEIALKWGTLNKTITVETLTFTNVLSLTVRLPEPDQREKNRIAAFADRQAVFKGDCAQCHATPAKEKLGKQLYTAACAICHDTEHRAEMVPDLAVLKTAADENYWKQWIMVGKPGSFMPGFHKRYGGPLTDEQINSLVLFLTERFSERVKFSGKPALPLD